MAMDKCNVLKIYFSVQGCLLASLKIEREKFYPWLEIETCSPTYALALYHWAIQDKQMDSLMVECQRVKPETRVQSQPNIEFFSFNFRNVSYSKSLHLRYQPNYPGACR